MLSINMFIYLFIQPITLLRTSYILSTVPGMRNRKINKTRTFSGSGRILKNQEKYIIQGIMSILRIKFDKREKDVFLKIYV